MGFDESFLSCGLFGYNSFLVGLAIATFDSDEMHMGYNWAAGVGVVITSYFSSVLFVMLGKILAPYKVSRAFHLGVLTLLYAHSCLTIYICPDPTIYVAFQYQHFSILVGDEATYQKWSR